MCSVQCNWFCPHWSTVLPTSSTCRHPFLVITFLLFSSLLFSSLLITYYRTSSSRTNYHLLSYSHLLPSGLFLVYFSIDYHLLSYIIFSNDSHILSYITYYRVAFFFSFAHPPLPLFFTEVDGFSLVSDSGRVSLTLEGEFPRIFIQ
jgi:hypothetical protein